MYVWILNLDYVFSLVSFPNARNWTVNEQVMLRPRASWENWRPLNWWRPCWTAFLGLVYGGGFMTQIHVWWYTDAHTMQMRWDALACLVNIPDSVEKQWPQNYIRNVHSTVCGCVQKPSYWICNHFNFANELRNHRNCCLKPSKWCIRTIHGFNMV